MPLAHPKSVNAQKDSKPVRPVDNFRLDAHAAIHHQKAGESNGVVCHQY
ncbi:Uncharacterised protein [Vibrio cholerae]|nr:Uncharacterised protein [Vibrio cholerae]